MWADGHMAVTEAWMEGRACQHGFSSSSSPTGTLSDSCFWITDAKAKRNRSQELGFYSSVKCHSSIHQEDEIPSLPSKKAALPVLLYLTRILQTCQGLGHQRDKDTCDGLFGSSVCASLPPTHLYINAAMLLSSGKPRGWGSLLRKLKEQTWHLNPLHISGVPYLSWCFSTHQSQESERGRNEKPSHEMQSPGWLLEG